MLGAHYRRVSVKARMCCPVLLYLVDFWEHYHQGAKAGPPLYIMFMKT